MASTTDIEWADATWNVLTGCSLVDEGCRNCYAARMAATRLKNHPSRKGLARLNADGVAKFTGETRFNRDWLTDPIRWKQPRKIFAVAHGDLFHENVADETIDLILAVAAMTRRHTYQILTKRPERALGYLTTTGREGRILRACEEIARQEGYGEKAVPLALYWPLRNVWIGTSVSDQESADQRVPILSQIPAVIRFLSIEPLLGPVTIGRYMTRLDWVIVGGESGPNARPMNRNWVRALCDECADYGPRFFFKQWGAWFPYGETNAKGMRNLVSKGKRPGYWHEWGDGEVSVRLGKKAAGRFLDGGLFDQFPRGV